MTLRDRNRAPDIPYQTMTRSSDSSDASASPATCIMRQMANMIITGSDSMHEDRSNLAFWELCCDETVDKELQSVREPSRRTHWVFIDQRCFLPRVLWSTEFSRLAGLVLIKIFFIKMLTLHSGIKMSSNGILPKLSVDAVMQSIDLQDYMLKLEVLEAFSNRFDFISTVCCASFPALLVLSTQTL